MKLRFTHDYLGRETAMKQYRMGDVADISVAQALELIRLEVAEEVEVFEPLPDFDYTVERVSKPKRRQQKDGDE